MPLDVTLANVAPTFPAMPVSQSGAWTATVAGTVIVSSLPTVVLSGGYTSAYIVDQNMFFQGDGRQSPLATADTQMAEVIYELRRIQILLLNLLQNQGGDVQADLAEQIYQP